MERFPIPVVLFFFRRQDTMVQILKRIEQVKPAKMYLISDGPRNSEERQEVLSCRKTVEEHITWECDIVRNYAEENRGVYNRIGEGAKWVFSMEETAIFLEDDNLPEVSFFEYCQEMLELYQKDTRVLWVCGTNYLTRYQPADNSSYMFTRHLLPCGWASWSDKFLSYYDGDLKLLSEEGMLKKLGSKYRSRRLYRYQRHNILNTLYKLNHDRKKASWDHQMCFSVRIQGMYGISPACNQIQNIGVDGLSTHGGTSYKMVMTRRFCGMDSCPLEFPLRHPLVVTEDVEYEKKIGRLILPPVYLRMKRGIGLVIKKLRGDDPYSSLTETLRKKPR